MKMELVTMAVMAGAANWAFRALPVLLMRRETRPGGLAARFLASTGPAAIATLFVASVLPQLWPVQRDTVPLAAGFWRRWPGSGRTARWWPARWSGPRAMRRRSG
ncbi:hypothetical protein MASR1M32_37060 [Rhodobacter sp.]